MRFKTPIDVEPLEDTPITYCDECNGELYEGDEVFEIDGMTICVGDGCLETYFESYIKTLKKGTI